ncbi:GNAT family N-acetyltransferase [Terracoccus luteus]|uniref:RimJ/RimL family protein N-acetyltransferase n=1 Tax=Terracoccus luteus TaxID=53356 RepID=A0A839PP67_9MICO|nr:GNAT family N-acetyltransferase [Terracoccus luteus]MBB2984869.1 RimJ/RimL family protein N-acetyltransferase [Terracoccus luteus]MCP2170521.1 RimJ/RimL family protein N-acetyltransferase [Terracoccus luteus]
MRENLTAETADGRGLALRPLKTEDAPRVQEACSDAETIKWLGGDIINERYSLEDARGFIECALHRVAAGSRMSWAIADANTDELLGHISLTGRGGELTDTAAVGYWSHPAARGAGVTTAAALAVVDEALSPAADGRGALRRLTLRAAVGNIGSQRVAEAAGFRRTGRRERSDLLIDGTFSDEFTYELFATDPR